LWILKLTAYPTYPYHKSKADNITNGQNLTNKVLSLRNNPKKKARLRGPKAEKRLQVKN